MYSLLGYTRIEQNLLQLKIRKNTNDLKIICHCSHTNPIHSSAARVVRVKQLCWPSFLFVPFLFTFGCEMLTDCEWCIAAVKPGAF